MSSTKVEYKDVNTGTGMSPALWANCPRDEMAYDNSVGILYQDDFLNTPQMITAQNVAKYASYIDTGVTIKQSASETNGAVVIAGNDADNDEGSITTGGNVGTMVVISDTAADAKQLWFEATIKVESIANNNTAFFVGLSEEGLAAADTMVDDTAVMADKDFIGFHTLTADGDALLFSYRKNGAAQVDIALDTASAVLVADTYVKVGFMYDPAAKDAKKIKIFVDGVEQQLGVTATQIATATFPDAEELAMLLATKNGDGASAAHTVTMNSWACAQLR